MSDLDDALASPDAARGRAGTGRRCKFARILDTVEPHQRTAILERLHSDAAVTGWSYEILAAAITRGGHPVSHASLMRHTRKLCSCAPDDESETR